MDIRILLLAAIGIGMLAMGRTDHDRTDQDPQPTLGDTCTYALESAPLTKWNREHYRPFLDTTIIRRNECGKHVLVLPSRGTVTSYLIVDAVTSDTVLHGTFGFSGAGFAWDITDALGDYAVHMGACHMGGDFKLSIR